jgi:S-formylglutathione hydrolase
MQAFRSVALSPLSPVSSPHWSTVAIAGRACEVFAPPDPLPGRALVSLHDLRGESLRDCPPLCAAVEAARLPVIAPQAGRCWWLDRPIAGFDATLTPERFVIDRLRPEIEARFGVRPPGIAVIGIGMGGQGALRLAYRHPAVFPVSAAIAPAIDFHRGMREAADRDDGELFDTLWESFGDVERARQDTAILHVHPLNWPRHQFFASDPADPHWHDGADRLHSKLVALGIPHTALLEPRADFTATAAAEAVRFVLAALDQESRRLPGG